MNKYLFIPLLCLIYFANGQSLDTLDDKILALDNRSIQLTADQKIIKSITISSERERDLWFHFNEVEESWADSYHVVAGNQNIKIRPENNTVKVLEATNGIDTILLFLHFFRPISNFEDAYVKENKGKVSFSYAKEVDIIHALFTNQSVKGEQKAENVNAFMDSYVLEWTNNQLVTSNVYYRPFQQNYWSDTRIKNFNKRLAGKDIGIQIEKRQGYHQKIVRETQQFTRLDSIWSWVNDFIEIDIDHINVLVSESLPTDEGFVNKTQSEDFEEWILVLPKNEDLIRVKRPNQEREMRSTHRAFLIFMKEILKEQVKNEKVRDILPLFRDKSKWMANKQEPLAMDMNEEAQLFVNYYTACYWLLYLKEQYDEADYKKWKNHYIRSMSEDLNLKYNSLQSLYNDVEKAFESGLKK